MRIIGLDLGDKKIGVSLSDPMGWTAQALDVIKSTGSVEVDVKKIKEMARQYEVEKLVVGLPKNMDGSTGPRAEKALHFAGVLQKATGLPVEMWDERLSTVAAERILLEADLSRAKRKKVIDKTAAAIILQGYLDSLGKK